MASCIHCYANNVELRQKSIPDSYESYDDGYSSTVYTSRQVLCCVDVVACGKRVANRRIAEIGIAITEKDALIKQLTDQRNQLLSCQESWQRELTALDAATGKEVGEQ